MQQEITFGEWLRKQRRSLDLSRQAFAAQVGCAEVTLRRIEAGTLKPSKELANLLVEKLGIPEAEHSQWISFARGLSGFPLSSFPSSNESINNLPAPLTTFIGRESEQTDVINLIAKHRLVTLTGSGGVGKTRLSIKVGEQVLGNYADGVWLVELAPILDPLLVQRTIAVAIGLRDEPQRPLIDMLCDYLREKNLLIILDNCEHLVNICAFVTNTLLKSCPRLKILVTSREPLQVTGEALYRVPSLKLPELGTLPDVVRDCESVKLFEERAQLVQFDFSLSSDSISPVAHICHRLDGIPLAIELAAAKINAFSAEQIAQQLNESFNLLTGGSRTALPRHQTLQATLEWSYKLLLPTEQTLFRRLAVFVNGWTLEAAEIICSNDIVRSDVIVYLLDRLIDKSLVIREHTGQQSRYRTLETIRQYANERLIESGESNSLSERHLDYFLNLAETAEPHLIRPEQLEWLPLLDADYENLRFALEWALTKRSDESSLSLCNALGWFWVIRCYWVEGLSWLTRALAKSAQNTNKNEKIARARALSMSAQLEWTLGNHAERILSPAEASLALAIEVSDKRDIAIARHYVGSALALGGDDSEYTLSLLDKSFAEFQELNDPFWQAQTYNLLGYLLRKRGKIKFHEALVRHIEFARKAGERVNLAVSLEGYATWLFRINRVDEAREYAEKSEWLYKQLGSENNSMNALLFAEIAWSNGDRQRARSLYLEMEERFRLLADNYHRAICLANLGILAMEEGNLDRAEAYLEQALMLDREAGSLLEIAFHLADLSNLSYHQGKIAKFKKTLKESITMRRYLADYRKTYVLMTIVDSFYYQKPESAARLMGVIHHYENDLEFPLNPVERRYWNRAETYVRKTLGVSAFEIDFEEGQKLSLDEALDLALKTVEEM